MRQREVGPERATRAGTNSVTDSDCATSVDVGGVRGAATASGGTGNSCSPLMWSAARLVTTSLSRRAPASSHGHARRGGRTCSKLSRTSKQLRSCRRATSVASAGRPASSPRPSAWRTVGATRSGSVIAASWTNATPSSNSSPTLARKAHREARLAGAARAGHGQEPCAGQQLLSLAELALPGRRRRTSRRAGSRSALPARGSAGIGCAGPRSQAGRGARARRCPSAGARRGRGRSRRRQRAADERTGRADSSTWPPWPAAEMRAARWMSSPTYSPWLSWTSPVWMPIRTATGGPSGQSCPARPRWASLAARTASARAGRRRRRSRPRS